MEPQSAPRRRWHVFSLVVGIAVISLVVGLLGGVSGFVLLENGKSAPLKSLRSALGLNGSSLAVPVDETINLQESSQVTTAAQTILPAVVAISASENVTSYFGSTTSQTVSGGSGFIITNDGLILTNRHVVDDPSAQYKVVLNDGRIFNATVQAKDTLNDLAVLKINATNLPVAQFGSSSNLQVGQFVLAVGNALGQFTNSVSSGIVSATNRTITAGESDGDASDDEVLTNLIQTDAAINPGNSGGPLVNLDGQVVGIDTAIATTDSGGSVGVGFAIPIDSIMSVINSVRTTGQIVRPSLGVSYVPVTPELQQLDNLSVNYGALVQAGTSTPAVVAGSPADKAGIVAGDILVDINGQQITQDMPLPDLLQKYSIGDTVTVDFMRGKQKESAKVTLSQTSGS